MSESEKFLKMAFYYVGFITVCAVILNFYDMYVKTTETDFANVTYMVVRGFVIGAILMVTVRNVSMVGSLISATIGEESSKGEGENEQDSFISRQ